MVLNDYWLDPRGTPRHTSPLPTRGSMLCCSYFCLCVDCGWRGTLSLPWCWSFSMGVRRGGTAETPLWEACFVSLACDVPWLKPGVYRSEFRPALLRRCLKLWWCSWLLEESSTRMIGLDTFVSYWIDETEMLQSCSKWWKCCSVGYSSSTLST